MTVLEPITVIMPVFNVALYLEEALESVLRQNYDALELIVIDDGSTDTTPGIIEKYKHRFGNKLKHIRQDNGGVSKARNVGLKNASGRLITFLDGDDILTDNLYATQAQLLHDNPQIDGVRGVASRFTERSVPFRDLPAACLSETYVMPQLTTRIVRAKVADIVGCFDETLLTGEDVDWLLRIDQKGFRILPTDLLHVYYRMRKGSLMATCTAPQVESILTVARKSIKRHRQQQQSEMENLSQVQS